MARRRVVAADEEPEVIRIDVPALRAVRQDEYRGLYSAVEAGRRWAQEEPELVERVRSDLRFRMVVVSLMRNQAWWLRNHRVVAVPSVWRAVSKYFAYEELLHLAGVDRAVTALLWEFFFTECGCKGDCASIDFDPLNIPVKARLCDHLFRTVHARHARLSGGEA